MSVVLAGAMLDGCIIQIDDDEDRRYVPRRQPPRGRGDAAPPSDASLTPDAASSDAAPMVMDAAADASASADASRDAAAVVDGAPDAASF